MLTSRIGMVYHTTYDIHWVAGAGFCTSFSKCNSLSKRKSTAFTMEAKSIFIRNQQILVP